MFLIIILLCCVCVNYGEINQDPNEVIVVHFDIRVKEGTAHCVPCVQNGNTTIETEVVMVEPGRIVRLEDGLQAGYGRLQKAMCTYGTGSESHDLGRKYKIQEHRSGSWFEEQQVTESMYGKWTCKLQFNYKTGVDIQPVDDENYTYVLCNITVQKSDPISPTTTPAPSAHQNEPKKTDYTWYIVGGAILGTIVLLIIIGQTIALCYFRKKAQPQRRMDKMPLRSLDRSDQVRYSRPPCKKSIETAPAYDRDSHIYEMVVVNANYNKASELVAALDCEENKRKMKERPPLPLPHEIPEAPETLPRADKMPSSVASVSSTLSLISNRSSFLGKKKGKKLPPPPVVESKKAPARPPKQIDEESLPGSLKRPAKASPSPVPAAASVYKPGSIAKKPTGTESQMTELKTILRNRNIGNDTPTPSPTATLEKKVPPNAKTKQNTKPTKMENQAKLPPTLTKPGQPNQMRLILPKIEASMKPLKPVPKTKDFIPKNPPPVKKPSSNLTQKWLPQGTQLAPKAEKQKTSPIQSLPLPNPEPRPLPEPLPQDDMPIYETTEEAESLDTDDDEEWTYEQLEQFNLYNM